MKSLVKRNQGFTLIEIVIVLAIAAAIILMVFIAVSGVRKSQRDTQRRTDAGRIAAQVEQYAANNGGTYPGSGDVVATAGTWFGDYVNGKFTKPGSTSSYGPGGGANGTTAYTAGFSAGSLPNPPTSSTQDLVYLDVSGSSYSVCIGAENSKVVCAQSK
jgi:prepilin-type N-terminal cleavage/methylation domain-containing protein